MFDERRPLRVIVAAVALVLASAVFAAAQSVPTTTCGTGLEIFPECYGAVGDGMTNDAAAFQQTFNDAWASGRTVRLRPVAYALTSTVSIPMGGNQTFSLLGANSVVMAGLVRTYGTRILCRQAAGAPCLSAVSTAFANPRYRFENISMVGPDTPYTGTNGTSGNAIMMTGPAVPLLTIRNVTIDNFTGPGTAGLWLDGPENGSLYDVYIQNVNECAELHNYQANNWYNVSCQYAINDGIHISGSDAFSMFGGMFQSNYRTGLHLDGLNGGNFHGVHFENNNTTATAGKGAITMTALALMYGNYHVTIQSCVFYGAHNQIITSGGDAFGYANMLNMLISNYMATIQSPAVTLDANAIYWTFINNNLMPGPQIVDPSGTSMTIDYGIIQHPQMYLGDLQNTSLVDGGVGYCRDCRNTAANGATAGAACQGGGTGAMARREHGVWICN